MAEVLKNVSVYKSKKGHKRKHKNDDTQLIRRVSTRLAERQRGGQNKDENIEITCVASRLTEHQNIRPSVGTYPKNKPCKQKLKEDNSKEKLNRIKSLRNTRIDLCNNDTAHLKSPQHKKKYTCKTKCKRLVLLDCKVVVKKLNLNKLKSLKNEFYGIYNHKTENFKLPTENEKLCFDKIISKGLPLLNCKVIVDKLNVYNLKSVKKENYHVSDNEKGVLELASQNEELPFDKTSKGLVKRKPNLDMPKYDANNSNSNLNDLPEKINEHNCSDTELVTRFIAPSTSKVRSKYTEYESESVINELTEIKTGQLVLGTTTITIENCSKPDITPCLDSNGNNLVQRYKSKVKTEIRNEPVLFPDLSSKQSFLLPNPVPEELVSEIKKDKPDITPCLDSNGNNLVQRYTSKVKTEIRNEPVLFPELSSKQSFLLPNPVPEELVSEIKKEPVEQLFDPSNVSNTTVCGSPEYFDKEKHANIAIKLEVAEIKKLDKEFYNSRTIDKPFENNVSTSILGKNVKEIKSEPNEISLGTQKDPKKCSNPCKIKGFVALRERLLMITSENQIKQELLKVNKLKKNANDVTCNPDQKNKDKTNLYNTKLDAAEVKESSNNHGEKQSNEVNDAVLSSGSQNGIGVDDNGSLSNLEDNIAKSCDADLAPLPIKQFALKILCDAKLDAVEVKEKGNNFRNIQANEVCRNIISCSIERGIVADNYDFHSDHLSVKNYFADLILLPGFPQNRFALSVIFGYDHIQTLVCREKFVFLNGFATQCKWIIFPIKVQFDGIWNKREGKLIPFVIWHGIKPRININQLFRFPMATDYFDVEGKCTSFDQMLRIRVEKFDFTLECSNIVSSFLNSNNKNLFIPNATPVNLYLRRYSSPNTEPKWTIVWMILYIR